MPRLPQLAAATVLAVLALAPGASAADRQSTPELIEQAAREGRIDTQQATVLRAQALAGAVPAAYRSDAPWEGTPVALQVSEDREELSSRQRARVRALAASASTDHCGANSVGALPNRYETAHFAVEYAALGGGLTVEDYGVALEAAWSKQVGDYGWAAPPTASGMDGKIDVRLDVTVPGLLGYVTNDGTYAETVADNPNTSWQEIAATASCMALRGDFGGAGMTAADRLTATTAHEFNHVLQFGYGTTAEDIMPHPSLFESGAVVMEVDTGHDSQIRRNHDLPYPSMPLLDYDDMSDKYGLYYPLRGMFERFGVGVAGGEEQVLQDFWETIGKRSTAGQNAALESVFASRGTTLGARWHDYAVALQFLEPCGGGYSRAHCLADAADWADDSTFNPMLHPERGGHGVAEAGAPYHGSVADDYAINWVRLPWGESAYDVTFGNTSTGGVLRATAVCKGLGRDETIGAFPGTYRTGESRTVSVDPAACTGAPMLAVTNEATSTGGRVPADQASAMRDYTVSVAGSVRPLHVEFTKGGNGSGAVAVAATGRAPFDCTGSCTTDLAPGDEVTLTPTAGAGSDFLGFSGAGCSGTDPCTVTLDRAREVFAGFGATGSWNWQRTRLFASFFNVTLSTDAGDAHEYDQDGNSFPCDGTHPSVCMTNDMPAGTPFTITATDTTAIEGQRQYFFGWQGPGAAACPAVRTCTTEMRTYESYTPIVAMGNSRSRLTVTTTGQGSVEIYNDISHDDRVTDTCSGTCEAWVLSHHGPKLRAVPAPGWRFAGFGDGDCRAAFDDKCGVEIMEVPRTVRATFEPIPQQGLTVTKAGTGSGTVSAEGLVCGPACTKSYDENSTVTLTAAPASGSSFGGWSGACSGTAGPVCTVEMTEARAVTATFTADPVVTPDPTPAPDPTPDPTPSATPSPTPAPTSDPAPATPAPGAAPSSNPLAPPLPAPLPEPAKLGTVTVKKQAAAAVAKSGLTVTLGASTQSTVKATLTVDKKTAEKLGLRVKRGVATAGSGSGTAGPSGGKLIVKLTSAAKARIKKAKTVNAILVLTTTAPGQAPIVTRKAVTIG